MDLLPFANHPNFSVKQFDEAVHRAHVNGLRVTEVVRGVAFVTSASRPGRAHRVTRTTCDCESHKYSGRCAHRALAIFVRDIMGGFDYPRPNSNVVFLHHRRPATAETDAPPAA